MQPTKLLGMDYSEKSLTQPWRDITNNWRRTQTILRAKGVDQLRDVLLVELAQVIGKLLRANFVEGYLDRTAKRSAHLSKYLQVVRCQAVHGGVFAGFEQSSSSRVLTNGYQSDNNGSHLWSR